MSNIGELIEINNDNVSMILAWRNSPRVRENMYTRHEISLDEHLAWWEKTKNRKDQKYFIYYYQKQPGGVIGLTQIDETNSNCCWAFYTSPDAPRGTGIRMEYLALEFVFEKLNLRKLYCEVLAFNKPVIKLHQKFGFEIEGIFKKQHFKESEYIDIYRLSIFSEEWREIRTEMLHKIT